LKLKVRPSRCLRRWYKDSNCSLCVESCPVNAIAVDGRDVIVDSGKCVLCGACSSICPTGVFSLGLEEVVERLEPSEEVKISCREVGERVITTCINALNLQHYVILASRHGRVVVDARCSVCPLSKGPGLKALEEAQRVLGARIEAIREGGGQSPLVRRAMLRRLVAGGATLASPPLGAVIAATYMDPVEVEDVRQPERAPIEFRLLSINAAKTLGVKLRVRHPTVDSGRCTFCGVCAGVCPTGAIEYEEAGILRIDPARCVGCEHCVKLCPENAMAMTESEELQVLEYTKSMTVCPRCGFVYPSSLGDCPKCTVILEIVRDIYRGEARDCKEYGERIREKLRSLR